jgi:ferric-dicitrate binding protein FerR (iron transport regulator)
MHRAGGGVPAVNDRVEDTLMAEIRVEEKRRGLGLLWLVLALALIALAVWYFNNNGVNEVDVQQTGALVRSTVLAMADASTVPLAA